MRPLSSFYPRQIRIKIPPRWGRGGDSYLKHQIISARMTAAIIAVAGIRRIKKSELKRRCLSNCPSCRPSPFISLYKTMPKAQRDNKSKALTASFLIGDNFPVLSVPVVSSRAAFSVFSGWVLSSSQYHSSLCSIPAVLSKFSS